MEFTLALEFTFSSQQYFLLSDEEMNKTHLQVRNEKKI